MPFTSGLLRDDAVTARGTTLAVDLRLPWMRSLPWESVDSIRLEVDGVPVDDDRVQLSFRGVTGGLDDFRREFPDWVIGEPVTATVASTPLAGADVLVAAEVTLLVPYIAGPGGGPISLPMRVEKAYPITTGSSD